MKKREPVSKKLRFEVFKRDGFVCAYCGAAPPAVVLEVDHIDPVSKGGGNDINNLITSCFDCNRGKKHIPLDKIPSKINDNVDVLKEKETQLKEYRKFISVIKRRRTRDINKVLSIFENCYPGTTATDKFKKNSIGKFIDTLPLDQVEEAMEIATNYIDDRADNCLKYFCGICWKKIKGEAR